MTQVTLLIYDTGHVAIYDTGHVTDIWHRSCCYIWHRSRYWYMTQIMLLVLYFVWLLFNVKGSSISAIFITRISYKKLALRYVNLWKYTLSWKKVCQWLVAGWWFSLGTPVSSSNKTDGHDISEILLKVVLNNIKPNQKPSWKKKRCIW